MRDIKFRAWHKKEKFMHTVAELHWCQGGIRFYGPGVGEGDFGDFELMQYTGVKNKDGKEIWEGDCFKTSDEHGYSSNCIAEVKFIEGCFAVHVHRKDLIQVIKPLYKYLEHYRDSTEIIGNIYENPELLEEKV